jgi:hypothetical protein
MALTLNDKRSSIQGEFLEMGGTATGSTEAVPFTSGFTVGFGASGFD